MLFDLEGIIDSADNADKLSSSERERTYSNIKSMNDLNYSQDGQCSFLG